MRDMISGVCPLSVNEMMAFTPGKWLAAYMADSAMVSSQRENVSPRRWCDFVDVGCFSAPRHTRAMACTVSTGYCPDALSADSITASV
ncbi:hypothetical protein D9M71_714350 [compost metagenome]